MPYRLPTTLLATMDIVPTRMKRCFRPFYLDFIGALNANWEALLMEMPLVLANLERLVDKMVGDLDVAIGLRRAAVHIEKNIQLSRRSSAPLESHIKLMALDTETGLLDVVASFNVWSPQHLTHVIKIMHVLVQEMERVPRHATSAWMVSTEEKISVLKKTIDKTLAQQTIPIVRPNDPNLWMSDCLKHMLLMEGYQQDTATDLESSNVEYFCKGPPWWDLESHWNGARSSTPEVILPMPKVPYDILGETFGHVVSDSNSDPYALIKTASCLSLAISSRLRSQAGCWAEVFILYLHPSDIWDLLSPLPNGVSLERLNTLTGVSLNMVDFQFYNVQQSRERFPMDILLTASCLHTLHAELFEPDLFDTPKSWDMPERYVLSSVPSLVLVPGKQPPFRATEMPPGVGLLPFPQAQCVMIFPRNGYRTLISEQTSNLISLTLCVSGYSSYDVIANAVVQYRELQQIKQYSRIDLIEGERYSFGNDFIPCFEMAPMDLEEDESEYDETKEIAELAAALSAEGIEL
ncbi:hypothetical protein IW261DRAFT_1424889 [Armillaria novae-zelandiae]|uniref:Uncharacterized protein n=1 Tax=Armillaria novae-zelandiae TaxID=153914 RepID=A0AA39NTY3_9AGAR|nr:hypothetical protein IW261DRAFT_1424889 [Armillaria novae-zelandiae]